MRKLALLVRAGAPIKAQAECFIAALEAQVLHGLGKHCGFAIIFEMISAGRCVELALAAFASGCALAKSYWLRTRLKQGAHVTSHLSELMHCLIQRPPVCAEPNDFRPDFPICVALTVRRPVSGRNVCVHRSHTFLSNALTTRRCAHPQMTMALRKTVWVLLSH